MKTIITLVATFAGIVTVLGFNYAVFMWINNMNQVRKDVYAIRTNHLPHVYRILKLICDKLGIDYSEGTDGTDKAGD